MIDEEEFDDDELSEPLTVGDVLADINMRLFASTSEVQDYIKKYPIILHVRGEEAVLDDFTWTDGMLVLTGHRTEAEVRDADSNN